MDNLGLFLTCENKKIRRNNTCNILRERVQTGPGTKWESDREYAGEVAGIFVRWEVRSGRSLGNGVV